MGNNTTNLFKILEPKRLRADKGFVYSSRDIDDQSVSTSCQHTPSSGSEATLGDEWFNYEMLEYYAPVPCKANISQSTSTTRGWIQTNQAHFVPLGRNVIVPRLALHVVTKENKAQRSPSAPAAFLSSAFAETAFEKVTLLDRSVTQSNLAPSEAPGKTEMEEQSSVAAHDILNTISTLHVASKETAMGTSSFNAQNVIFEPIIRFPSTSVRLSTSAPATILSKPSVEAFCEVAASAEPAAALPDVAASNPTPSLQPEDMAGPTPTESAEAPCPESAVGNEASLTETKYKHTEGTEGCLGRTGAQLIAALKSCIGLRSNGFMAYSVSYILKDPSSHERLVQ
ncbi:uncharacterized protein LOC144607753 [Rhinoraja longicauda]